MITLLLIRPKHFGYNVQTESTNSFQRTEEDSNTHLQALDEFNRVVHVLKLHSIPHEVVDDTQHPIKPDAIFGNNWISTHREGRLVLYPMMAENRRPERRSDLIDYIVEKFEFTKTLDYAEKENENVFLEGTGSLVFDRKNKFAFLSRSSRSSLSLAEEVCHQLKYELVSFTAISEDGQPIYHTNVIMSIGDGFVVWCPDMISDQSDRVSIRNYMEKTKKESIEITKEQVRAFAGNVLEVTNTEGSKCLLLSSNARRSLSTEQIFALRNHCALLPVPIPTIERIGGGSIRCILTEIVH